LERGEAFDPAWVEAKVAAMIETLGEVLDRCADERRPTDQVAIEMAKERIARGRPLERAASAPEGAGVSGRPASPASGSAS
jgi:hypothetical protein